MTKYRTVNLPEDLCAKAETRGIGGFDNVEALLSFLLQEMTQYDASKLDQAEQQMIEQRLKDLGYL